jgi:hypothetical protein
MARAKRTGTKSQAIRDYLAMKPDATPKVIKAALAEKGIRVGDSLISQIKYKSPRPGNGRLSKDESEAVSLSHLLAAKALASRVGGVEQARRTIEILARLERV